MFELLQESFAFALAHLAVILIVYAALAFSALCAGLTVAMFVRWRKPESFREGVASFRDFLLGK